MSIAQSPRPASLTAHFAPLRPLRGIQYLLVALMALPFSAGCESLTNADIADDRADHHCGPDWENAYCGSSRCCSAAGWCGGEDEPHCNSQHGYGGKFDGPTGSTTVDCTQLCAKYKSVTAELSCKDAESETACTTKCQTAAADATMKDACKAKYNDQIDCYDSAPIAEWSCSSAGDPPYLDVSNDNRCADAVTALVQCVLGK